MLNQHVSWSGLLWAAVGSFVFLGPTGCASRSDVPQGIVKKAPVSGLVTMGGEPMEGVEVYFYTEKFTGYATTNAEGKFRLVQGAAIGKNKVFFSKLEGWNEAPGLPNDPVMALNDPGQVQAAMRASPTANAPPKQLIPAEYTSQKSTKLTFDVPEPGAKDADFSL